MYDDDDRLEANDEQLATLRELGVSGEHLVGMSYGQAEQWITELTSIRENAGRPATRRASSPARAVAPPTGDVSAVRSILFATDFSENADVALWWALRMAKTHDASLMVLHVADAIPMSFSPERAREDITRNLDTLVTLLKRSGVDASSAWRTGRPWQVITAIAAEHDLVVLGAHGQTPFLHLPRGSTADRVLRLAPVPVLTIHPDNPVREGLPRTVVVPTDFSATAARALDDVVRLFGHGRDSQLEVTLLHAWQPFADFGHDYAAAAVLDPYLTTEQGARGELERIASEARREGARVTPLLRAGYPAKVVEDVARAIGADLIALGTHGRSGLERFMLGSVAERIAHRASCPVLSVGRACVEAGQAGDATPAEAHA